MAEYEGQHGGPGGPIACSLAGADFEGRAEEWTALARQALIGREAPAGGVVLRFRRAPEVEAGLQRLIRLEADCCPFLTFDLTLDGGEVVLTVGGPAEAASTVAGFLELPVSGRPV